MRFTHVSDHSRSTGCAPHAAVMNTVAIISLFMVVRISRIRKPRPAAMRSMNRPVHAMATGPRHVKEARTRPGGFTELPIIGPTRYRRAVFRSKLTPFAKLGCPLTGIAVGLSCFGTGESIACKARGWPVRPSASVVDLSMGCLSDVAPGRAVATIVALCNDCCHGRACRPFSRLV